MKDINEIYGSNHEQTKVTPPQTIKIIAWIFVIICGICTLYRGIGGITNLIRCMKYLFRGYITYFVRTAFMDGFFSLLYAAVFGLITFAMIKLIRYLEKANISFVLVFVCACFALHACVGILHCIYIAISLGTLGSIAAFIGIFFTLLFDGGAIAILANYLSKNGTKVSDIIKCNFLTKVIASTKYVFQFPEK